MADLGFLFEWGGNGLNVNFVFCYVCISHFSHFVLLLSSLLSQPLILFRSTITPHTNKHALKELKELLSYARAHF